MEGRKRKTYYLRAYPLIPVNLIKTNTVGSNSFMGSFYRHYVKWCLPKLQLYLLHYDIYDNKGLGSIGASL